MSTYKVFLKRVLAQGHWDWKQTIVAKTSHEAINYAYDNWVDSNPLVPVPPLANCTTRADLLHNTTERTFGEILVNSSVTPSQQEFMNAIKSKVSSTLGSQLDGDFDTVNYPAGFNYGITFGPNAYYNPATMTDIDAMLAVASNGELEINGTSFSGYYSRLLGNVAFTFSQADQQTMNAQDTAASGQIASVISAFTNAGGAFTSPLPLGGKLQDIFNQLLKTYGSMSKLPDTLNTLRNAIASYKSIAAQSFVLHANWYSAQDRLSAAIGAVTTPSAANGGMQTGATSYAVGYTPKKLMSANQLIGGLSTATNQINMSLALSNFSSTQSDLSINGKVGFTIPILDILDISFSASASYNLSKYAASSTGITMDITYPGVTIFPSAPSILAADNVTGWYANDILQEVVRNTGNDITGYALQGSEYSVDHVFGINKIFSRLKTFVISQQPTVEITFKGSELSKVVSDMKLHAKVDVKLFDIFSLGSASANYTVHKVDDKSVKGSVTVTFGPPKVSGTIPIEQQKAYVLGGVASYPPNNI